MKHFLLSKSCLITISLLFLSNIIYAQLPNLVPQNITLNKSSVEVGQSLKIDWALANTGNGNSPSTVTGVRLNQSSTSHTGTTITNINMPALNAHSSTPQTTTITIPTGTTPGTYYIWIIADNVTSGAITQTNYNDDFQHSAAFTVNALVQLPNLVPENITLNKSSVEVGQSLKIDWALANTGDGNSPSTVTGVRLNQSSTSHTGTTITNVNMSALNAHSSTPQTATITIPTGTTPGTYYIWIIADNVTSGAITQTNYNDDFQHSAAFTVNALVQLPNLVPENVTLNKNSVEVGQSLKIDWALANTGDGNSPSTVTGVRLNQSSTSHTGTTITNVNMPALNAHSSTPQTATITIPTGTTPGTYYIWIIADNVTSGVIIQTNYDDDFQHSAAFTVTGGDNTIHLNKMWSEGHHWTLRTYEGHGGIGTYNAADFYYLGINRPDIYRNSYSSTTSIIGENILAPHNGQVYIVLYDVTDEAIGYPIDNFPAYDGGDNVPNHCFRINNGSIYIDMSLKLDEGKFSSWYSHLDLAQEFFTQQVKNQIKSFVSSWNGQTRIIDANSIVYTGENLGQINKWGLTQSGAHLHFEVRNQNGQRYNLSTNSVLLDNEIIMNPSFDYDLHYPAIPRNNLLENQKVEIFYTWMNPIPPHVNIRSEAGGVDIGDLINGEKAIILDGPSFHLNIADGKPYLWYKIKVDNSTLEGWVASEFLIIVPTDIKNDDIFLSKSINISQNFPNPFNPTTTIYYSLPKTEYISLKVYDLLGDEIATLVNEEKPADNYSIEFDGSKLASGVYFYTLTAGDFSQTNKMILTK